MIRSPAVDFLRMACSSRSRLPADADANANADANADADANDCPPAAPGTKPPPRYSAAVTSTPRQKATRSRTCSASGFGSG